MKKLWDMFLAFARIGGLTFGGGLTLSRFKAGISYARYHVSSSSLMFNVAYSL